MRIFEEGSIDLNLVYDFYTMPIEKKKVFIEKAFCGERILIDTLFSGAIADFFMSIFEKGYREHRNNMINGLNGKMTFDEFKSYFASFFWKKWMSWHLLKNMTATSVCVRKNFNFWETRSVDSLSTGLLMEIFIRPFMMGIIIFNLLLSGDKDINFVLLLRKGKKGWATQ